jgi:LPS-assembly protein
MLRLSVILILCISCEWLQAASATAQVNVGGCRTDLLRALRSTSVDGNHYVLNGTADEPVEIVCDDVQLFANHVELFNDENRFVAIGDVLFVSGTSRISAERLEFNTRTKTGTFYNASGTTIIRDKSQPGQFGAQEPNAFFWGEELHKVGQTKYRIVRGGFTTCVQPTPRWEIASGSMTIALDDYALLRNSLFKVKGVPLLYLPAFYYPLEEDDRSTGFLMPIYGTSTIRGQSISTPFFWAISRSQDATFTYDWFSKAGRAVTGEYRYVLSPGSSGNAAFNLLDERAITAENGDGVQAPRAGDRSYTINGSLVQALPRGFRLQANANYFTSLASQQRYQQDVYQATNRQRNFDTTLSGNWGEYAISGRIEQRDYFDSEDTLIRRGALPRITVARGERPLGRLPIYFGVNGEYVNLLDSRTSLDVEIEDEGLTRLDVTPTVRIPFTRWPFLTVNSSVGWRGTYWTESLDAAGLQIGDAISRQYFTLQSRITGPVFTRIFNPGAPQKFKHVIEPTLTIQRTTAIDQFDRIVQLDSTDYVRGGVTRYTYGLSNRLYAKKAVSREVASLNISQSYYTRSDAAQYDRDYQSSYSRDATETNFSPVAVVVRSTPTDRTSGEFRTEWDPAADTLRTLSASGSIRTGEWLDLSAGWSRKRFIHDLPGFNRPELATHYLNASTTVRTANNRLGGSYSFNYDFQRDFFLQQRVLGYYNAQCCGIVLEWQTFNLQGIAGIIVPQDRRFNISFTLAGIGTFSNFLGALSGQQQQR